MQHRKFGKSFLAANAEKNEKTRTRCSGPFSKRGSSSGRLFRLLGSNPATFMHMTDNAGKSEVDNEVDECCKAENGRDLLYTHGLPRVSRQKS